MLPVVNAESSYEFVPPKESPFWPRLLAGFIPGYLRRRHGISGVTVRNAERLESLLERGDGILLAPNHCRMADPLVLQRLSAIMRQPFFVMASSHLFSGSRFFRFLLPRLGAFSVYREGVDRQAVQKAIDILTEGKRPLVIFPEGALSHANERLNAMMDGVPFIARSASRKLERAGDPADGGESRNVYVVPVALRYLYEGDIQVSASRMLTRIERRLSWRPREDLPLVDRIYRVGGALLGLKELEHLGAVQSGELDERVENLIDRLLDPLEQHYAGETNSGSVISRVKDLRKAILPAMIDESLDEAEMQVRWNQLSSMELAQQLSLYPRRYVASRPSVDRILETVERFVEHFDGEEEANGPMRVIVEVGEPILVKGKRDRGATEDPVLTQLSKSLSSMLEGLSTQCRMVEPSD